MDLRQLGHVAYINPSTALSLNLPYYTGNYFPQQMEGHGYTTVTLCRLDLPGVEEHLHTPFYNLSLERLEYFVKQLDNLSFETTTQLYDYYAVTCDPSNAAAWRKECEEYNKSRMLSESGHHFYAILCLTNTSFKKGVGVEGLQGKLELLETLKKLLLSLLNFRDALKERAAKEKEEKAKKDEANCKAEQEKRKAEQDAIEKAALDEVEKRKNEEDDLARMKLQLSDAMTRIKDLERLTLVSKSSSHPIRTQDTIFFPCALPPQVDVSSQSHKHQQASSSPSSSVSFISAAVPVESTLPLHTNESETATNSECTTDSFEKTFCSLYHVAGGVPMCRIHYGRKDVEYLLSSNERYCHEFDFIRKAFLWKVDVIEKEFAAIRAMPNIHLRHGLAASVRSTIQDLYSPVQSHMSFELGRAKAAFSPNQHLEQVALTEVRRLQADATARLSD